MSDIKEDDGFWCRDYDFLNVKGWFINLFILMLLDINFWKIF